MVCFPRAMMNSVLRRGLSTLRAQERDWSSFSFPPVPLASASGTSNIGRPSMLELSSTYKNLVLDVFIRLLEMAAPFRKAAAVYRRTGAELNSANELPRGWALV